MKRKARIGGYFLPIDDTSIAFESANGLKSSIMMMFYVLFGLEVLAEIVSILHGYPSMYHEITQGADRAPYLIFLVPFILPVIWFFLPPIKVTLNRVQGTAHFTQGKRKFEFPWSQINFNHQWFPTKTGGATLFTLISVPPYPDQLTRLIEKKGRVAPGQVFTFKLGSFDVKNQEHGQAIFDFLNAWMTSREPAEMLYDSIVRSKYGC